jgi:hypothetical protein
MPPRLSNPHQSPLENFEAMMGQQSTSTLAFHELMSRLDPTQSEREMLAREYMEYLLHLPPDPNLYEDEGEKERARIYYDEMTREIKAGFISLVTMDEMDDVIKNDERSDPPAWSELRHRAACDRMLGYESWRQIAIERHKMHERYLKALERKA